MTLAPTDAELSATLNRGGADPDPAGHPRTLGWIGVSALAIGGSNQSLFLIGALIAAQGSAAVPLLAAGLLLSWAAAPGWIELVLMWPKRVGGIAATCAEAFRPYSPVLANLTGVCYWWGWVPTCGLTALLSASALHQWYLPGIPVTPLAAGIVVVFTAVNLCGVRWVTRVALPVAAASALLAFLSAVVPVFSGHVDWHQASSFHLVTPFGGIFGGVTSAMAGLYLIGFAAPAFEAATCHVGEMRDPTRTLPRAVFASAAMAGLYFVVLPVVWLGVFGADPLGGDLASTLGPTFAPLLGAAAKSAAIWFMVFNMFHGSLQPLAGASRTLSQLAEDGLLPQLLQRRMRRTDCPWVATVFTAAMALVFLAIGDPTWMIAGANLTYLIGIALPSVAVWLLRRDAPALPRPYRAPRGTIVLGVVAAVIWGLSTVLGFQQFGLPTVLFGIGLAYSGSALYAWRVWSDHRRSGTRRAYRSIHVKLTGAMLAVLVLDGAGYLLAVTNLNTSDTAFATVCEDIFVAVALLSISVGLILPGMIAHAATQVADAAVRLATGTLADFTRAMEALGNGELARARADVNVAPVVVHTKDEIGVMAASFNTMLGEIARSSAALDSARDQMQADRDHLERLAFKDPLTGLANRSLFIERTGHALRRSTRQRTRVAVVLVDLDYFKNVNDSLGHAAGDQLLADVGRRLGGAVRPADTTARLGGDEFALLLDDLKEQRDARRAAVRCLRALRAPFALQGRNVFVRASVGIAMSSAGADPHELLRNADIAMYAAKARGRNRYEVFSSGLHAQAVDRLQREQDLRDAVTKRQLRVVYQPKIAALTGKVAGAEALVRWQHPVHGTIRPDEFIALAEETGLIVDIDAMVLRTACAQARAWIDAGHPPVQMAVNISGREFEYPGLVRRVRLALRDTGLDPTLLELEITESAAVRQPREALVMLEELRAMGVRIAIDDFGTGYSLLSSLQQFPIDTIKVDKSFIDKVANVDEAPIVAAMIAMGHALGLDVVAEGVESERQADILRRHDCDQLQGFLYSRPLAAMDFERLLRAAGNHRDGLTTLRVLEVVSPLVSSQPDLERLSRSLLGELERLTGLESTFLVTGDGDVRRVLYAHNGGDLAFREQSSLDGGDALFIAEDASGVAYAAADVRQQHPASAMVDLGVRSWVSAPVALGDDGLCSRLCGTSTATGRSGPAVMAVVELFAQLLSAQARQEASIPARAA